MTYRGLHPLERNGLASIEYMSTTQALKHVVMKGCLAFSWYEGKTYAIALMGEESERLCIFSYTPEEDIRYAKDLPMEATWKVGYPIAFTESQIVSLREYKTVFSGLFTPKAFEGYFEKIEESTE